MNYTDYKHVTNNNNEYVVFDIHNDDAEFIAGSCRTPDVKHEREKPAYIDDIKDHVVLIRQTNYMCTMPEVAG